MLMPSLAAQYSYMLYPVTNAEAFNIGKITNFDQVGFKALDDYTLRIDVAQPDALSAFDDDSRFLVSRSHLRRSRNTARSMTDANTWTRPEHFVGNGPFVLKEWRMNSHILVEKSPTYWDAAHVRLNKIYFDPDRKLRHRGADVSFRPTSHDPARRRRPKSRFIRKYKPNSDRAFPRC